MTATTPRGLSVGINDLPEKWFLIKHECGAVMTISMTEILKSYSERNSNSPQITCPSCGKQFLNIEKLGIFFEQYAALLWALKEEKSEIKEIESPAI